MPLHSDQYETNRQVGQSIRLAGSMGLLTDQNVVDATTYASLQASIRTNAATLHADASGSIAERIIRALQIGYDDGTLSDSAVAAATGVDNLASLTLSAPGKIGPGIE